MICNQCHYYVHGECILNYEGAYDADGELVDNAEDVCMCEHQMDLED